MIGHPFRFTVADLRRERAASRTVSITESVDWRLELSRVLPDYPMVASLELLPMPGGILVMGTTSATIRHTCYRCLDQRDEALEMSVSQLFIDESDADGADYVIEGGEIDVEPMLRDEVLLDLPLTPICEADCVGVVDAVESRLNTVAPDDEDHFSSPFEVLRELLDEGQ
jgi:uncharacterized protein